MMEFLENAFGYSGSMRCEDAGSGLRNRTGTSSGNEWLPELPGPPNSRSARQKRKKIGKSKRRKTSKGRSVRFKSRNEITEQGNDSDEESVSLTVDSNDTDNCSKYDDDDDDDDDDDIERSSSNETEDSETKNVETEAAIASSKTQSPFLFSTEGKQQSHVDLETILTQEGRVSHQTSQTRVNTVQGGVRQEMPVHYNTNNATVKGGVRQELQAYHDTSTACMREEVKNEGPKSTVQGRGSDEESLQYFERHTSNKGYENGKNNHSNKIKYEEDVLKKHERYISEHISATRINRYLKLMSTAIE